MMVLRMSCPRKHPFPSHKAKGIKIPGGGGCSVGTKNLRTGMKFNWNFQRGTRFSGTSQLS